MSIEAKVRFLRIGKKNTEDREIVCQDGIVSTVFFLSVDTSGIASSVQSVTATQNPNTGQLELTTNNFPAESLEIDYDGLLDSPVVAVSHDIAPGFIITFKKK